MAERDDEASQSVRSFRVGDWLVLPELGRIERGDQQRRMEPKVMGVLVELATRAGELLSKAELTDAVWQLPYISENRLTGVIADLRRAFEDDVAEPRFVETIPTRGYRLVAPVEWLDAVAAPTRRRESRFKLELPDRGHRLWEGATVVGRGLESDVHIDSEWVSRRHARIVVDGDRATIEDIGSKNGTHVNGVPVTEVVPLRDGDEIRLGKGAVVLRFLVSIGATRTEASTAAADL